MKKINPNTLSNLHLDAGQSDQKDQEKLKQLFLTKINLPKKTDEEIKKRDLKKVRSCECLKNS